METLAEAPRENGYRQILRATAWVGGSQVVNIGIGIVRTKAMALLLGPAGFGLLGLYSSITELTQAVAGLGLNNSGVRQVAQAAGTGEQGRISRTARSLRWASLAAGLLGAIALFAGAAPIALATFGNTERTNSVRLLAIVVLLNLLAAGQAALLQGLRRVSEFAITIVLGAAIGTAGSITTVYYFGEAGLLGALLLTAGTTLGCSWWFSRQVPLTPTPLDWPAFSTEIRGLLGLGIAFTGSALLTMGSAYLIRMMVTRDLGLSSTGLYQAAWTLGGLYVGMVLQAMGTDFYPRLTAVAHEDAQCNAVVNEQTQVSLLLAGPGVLGTLVLAPLALAIFYAPQFSQAVDTLRWLCLGIAARVVGWPLGYVLIARNKKAMFFGSDLIWTATHLSLAYFLVSRVGLTGTGIAFFSAYLVQSLLNFYLVRSLTSFSWSTANRNLILELSAFLAFALWSLWALPPAAAYSVGIGLLIINTGRVLMRLRMILGVTSLSFPGARWLAAWGTK